MAVDAVFDSVGWATTFAREELADVGVIFCLLIFAVQDHPELVERTWARSVPQGDNFYAR